MKTIYLDNNATSRVAPEVVDAMLPYLSEYYGNPSSMHSFGGQVSVQLKEARARIAALLGADTEELLRGLLGLSHVEIERLRERGAI